MKLMKIIFVFIIFYFFKRLFDLFKTGRLLKEEQLIRKAKTHPDGSKKTTNHSQVIDADYRVLDN